MRYQSLIIAAVLGVAVSAPVLANDLKPVQSQSIDLGDVAGDLYYTVEQDGFHVVATFAQRETIGTPVRLQAVLAPGQALTFSSPRAAGEQPVSFSIRRQDQQVIVADAPLTN
jgi:hypothetical protein